MIFVLPPVVTVDGDAEMDKTGGGPTGVTMTVTLRVATTLPLPSIPSIRNVEFFVRVPLWNVMGVACEVPEPITESLPKSLKLEVLSALYVIFVVAPEVTGAGDALMVTLALGAGVGAEVEFVEKFFALPDESDPYVTLITFLPW